MEVLSDVLCSTLPRVAGDGRFGARHECHVKRGERFGSSEAAEPKSRCPHDIHGCLQAMRERSVENTLRLRKGIKKIDFRIEEF